MHSKPSLLPHLARLNIMKVLQGALFEKALREAHQVTEFSIVEGRNITAGYTRGWGICFGDFASRLKKDPIFQESAFFAQGRTFLSEEDLLNIFIIMKYGMQGMDGDIIEIGGYGSGGACFMANVARRLGWKSKVYLLNTFQGVIKSDPFLDCYNEGDLAIASREMIEKYVASIGLSNLILIDGNIVETFPKVVPMAQPIILANIDCYIYSIIKETCSILPSYLHRSGAYLIFHDPLHSCCLGSLQAVEDLVEKEKLYAEQTYPQLVYRFPKL